MSEVEQIVARLTQSQKDAVAFAHGPRPRVFGRGVTRKSLRDRGLCHGDLGYLTPLGLAVRAKLSENPNV